MWEPVEIRLTAERRYQSPYRGVEVWVDLEGPGFRKRAYGFWDGGQEYRVRVVAPAAGSWSWVSGSSQEDSGLAGRRGAFTAVEWTEAEKAANPCRRGFLRATANGHALEHADGTPCLLLGDTWWSAPTFRYRWEEEALERPIGPEMSFQDMVQVRKAQGYNCIAILSCFPNWANDGRPRYIRMADEARTGIRSAWRQGATDAAKDMHNEGGRPFEFPGKVTGQEDVFPDVDRLNPRYFQFMDRKIDYLNAQGFIPFIEVARRDVGEAWRAFYDWPASYARFVQYVFARYQAHNCILSPIHFDWHEMTIPSRVYNEAANLVFDRYGPPPFGTLLSANASPSTLVNFGDEARWLTLHQTGNWREHDHYWYLTEIFRAPHPRPALQGEPYYPGFPDDDPPAPSEDANLNCRSGMYGSVLSGALGGYIYGAEGLWGGDIEEGARYRMWDALHFASGDQVRHLRTFLMSEGRRYQGLVPDADLVTPNKSGRALGYRGWAFCARTPERDFFLCYFEKDCPQPTVRGAVAHRTYRAQWFNPRTGSWRDAGSGRLVADMIGRIALPPLPADHDWGLRLTLEG
jgi:hypothetical protein